MLTNNNKINLKSELLNNIEAAHQWIWFDVAAEIIDNRFLTVDTIIRTIEMVCRSTTEQQPSGSRLESAGNWEQQDLDFLQHR